MRPDGLPIWTSDAMPGHLHDLTRAPRLDVTGAPYWAASTLGLPTLADSGYEGTGQGIHTPYKQPTDSRRLAVDNRAYNAALRSMRCLGERGFAIIAGRWRTLRHNTASPRQIGDIAAPLSTSPISNTATYRILVEITSMGGCWVQRVTRIEKAVISLCAQRLKARQRQQFIDAFSSPAHVGADMVDIGTHAPRQVRRPP